MSSSTPTTRRLTAPNEKERTRIIEVLKMAMINDNAILCVTGTSKTSEKVLYEICMNACLADGEVWVAGFDNEIQAVSFWIRPGADFHIGMSDDYVRDLGDDLKEWVTHHFTPKYNELYQSSYPNGHHARAEAWHLLLIGVQPAFQRRGLGRLLVDTLREVADRESQTIMADVQTSLAVHFFNKLGFKDTGVKNFMSKHAGFPIWNMLRLPSQAAPTTG